MLAFDIVMLCLGVWYNNFVVLNENLHLTTRLRAFQDSHSSSPILPFGGIME